jgi:hypothetical protein
MSRPRRSRSLGWRVTRWAVLAAIVPALWACNNRRLEKPRARRRSGSSRTCFQQSINRDIDIVFMIDNSRR